METKSFYLTKGGLQRIQQEYQKLQEFKKAKTKGEVPAIWHSEDVNPEYLSFQEDLSLLEARIAEYEQILNSAVLITPPSKGQRETVCLGARVMVEVDGEVDEFEIVGTIEANPSLGKISNESPVGRALLGKSVGDEVGVSSPTLTTFRIKKIRYTHLERI